MSVMVPALDRGIAILRLFRRDRPVLSPAEIAEALAIPRSTVHRLVTDLTRLGLMTRNADGGYLLDAGVLSLGFEYLASLDLVNAAAPELEALRNETGWSTHLAVRQQRSVVYLSRFPSRAAVTRNIAVGSAAPAHATLMGRLLLSDLDPGELRRLYAGVDLEAVSERTPSSLADLEHMLAVDRARGYIASEGFYESDVTAVAAPLRDASLKIVGAINAITVGGADTSTQAVVNRVLAAARRISRLLGAPEYELPMADAGNL